MATRSRPNAIPGPRWTVDRSPRSSSAPKHPRPHRVSPPDDRVLSTALWDTADDLVDNLLAVFVARASLVQVTNPDPSLLERRRQTEKITRG